MWPFKRPVPKETRRRSRLNIELRAKHWLRAYHNLEDREHASDHWMSFLEWYETPADDYFVLYTHDGAIGVSRADILYILITEEVS